MQITIIIRQLFCLLAFLISTVSANTEVTLIKVDNSSSDLNEIIRNNKFQLYDGVTINSKVSYIVLPTDSLGCTNLYVNMVPFEVDSHTRLPYKDLDVNTDVQNKASTREIYISLQEMDSGFYFTRLCWSAMNPVDIHLEQIDNSLFLIEVTANYYTSDLFKSKSFLENIELKLHLSKNDKPFGLNDQLITLVKFMVSLTVVSLGSAKLFYSLI